MAIDPQGGDLDGGMAPKLAGWVASVPWRDPGVPLCRSHPEMLQAPLPALPPLKVMRSRCQKGPSLSGASQHGGPVG